MVRDRVAAIEQVTPDERPHLPRHRHFRIEPSNERSRNDGAENGNGDGFAENTDHVLGKTEVRLVDSITGHLDGDPAEND